MKRKIIQIVDSPDTETTQGYLMALCDDGTVWYFQYGNWEPMLQQIPQYDLPEA
jgi:hypothetical protein